MSAINAGLATLRGSNAILNSTQKGMPDHTGLAILSQDLRNLENTATKKVNQEAWNRKLTNDLAVKKIDMQKDLDKWVKKKYEPVQKHAGILAGVQGLASTKLVHDEGERLKKQAEILKNEREGYMDEFVKMYWKGDARTGSMIDLLKDRLDQLKEKNAKGPQTYSVPNTTSTPSTSTPNSSTNSSTLKLTGANKKIADYVRQYESGDLGFDAMNQGTDAAGNIVGSGAFSKILGGGTPLTSLSLQQVFDKQAGYDDRTISDAEWRKRGGLHAAGAYQFIGPTLKEEVRLMGLPLDTKFTPEVQAKIFLSHVKRTGNLGAWEGVKNRADRAEMEQLIPQIDLENL